MLLNGKCWCSAKQANPYIPVYSVKACTKTRNNRNETTGTTGTEPPERNHRNETTGTTETKPPEPEQESEMTGTTKIEHDRNESEFDQPRPQARTRGFMTNKKEESPFSWNFLRVKFINLRQVSML